MSHISLRQKWIFGFLALTYIVLLPTVTFSQDDLLEKMKSVQCPRKNSSPGYTREATEHAHNLLDQAELKLTKGIAGQESLLKETLRIVLCMRQHDKDAQSAEMILPLYETQRDAFVKVLKSFSTKNQKSLTDDFEMIKNIQKYGSD